MNGIPLSWRIKHTLKKLGSTHSLKSMVSKDYARRENEIRFRATSQFQATHPEFSINGYMDGWDCYVQWIENDIKRCLLLEFWSDAQEHIESLRKRTSVTDVVGYKVKIDEAPRIINFLPSQLSADHYIDRWPEAQSAALGRLWLAPFIYNRTEDEARGVLTEWFKGFTVKESPLVVFWDRAPALYRFSLISSLVIHKGLSPSPLVGWRTFDLGELDLRRYATENGGRSGLEEQEQLLLRLAQYQHGEVAWMGTEDFKLTP